MNDTWTIQAALDWTVGYLERKGDENPRLSAQWLLSEATNLSRIELYAHFDQPLSVEERDVLRGFVTRRGNGEPLQYITGEVGFRHITVKVRPGVLIPRPETEVLVSEGLATLPAPPKRVAAESEAVAQDSEASLEDEARDLLGTGEMEPEAGGADDPEAALVDGVAERVQYLVADLCTGTGCIACSIAYEHPETRVIATDLAPEAVVLAQENARLLGVEDRVEVIACDLGSGIDPACMGSFDLVISNPPYIPTEVLADIPHEVSDFEPNLALDGGADGLDLFRPIATWARKALASDGALVVELHETCLDAAAAIARAEGFMTTKITEDLAGRPRVLIARGFEDQVSH
ncbi:MAG: HemK/PrmC family methyltransferase [Raoultibacter sp.]